MTDLSDLRSIVSSDLTLGVEDSARNEDEHPRSAPRWRGAYVRRLLIGDIAALLSANLFAVLARFGGNATTDLHGVGYSSIALGIAGIWLVSLYACRAYEWRFLGSGSEEYKRVGSASLRMIAAVAVLAVALKADLARGFLLISLGVGTALLLLHRYVARRLLTRRRQGGDWRHRVLVVGSEESASGLTAELARDEASAFEVVGACVAAAECGELEVRGRQIPVVGGLPDIAAAARRTRADTIAVAASVGITPQVLRRLAWQLEGSGIDLIVAPALTNVAGPRISIRPVAGLPLLHVEEPEISGVRYLLKEVVERSFAFVVLVGLLLPMLAIAVLISLDSRGPVLFRQRRVGRNGREFDVLKFRSMCTDAEARLEEVRRRNLHAGAPLFKLRDDPRVTRAGKWLRRYSMDELPQLWNVVRGEMVLVGPRPPLPSEVAVYATDVKRRLLVKPGMTGLWQVSGRSDLSWEDSVRLDLHYVENWSFAMDAQILLRTLRVVLAGRGAY